MSESLSQLEDIFADQAISELYELHMARGAAQGITEEEAALTAQALHMSDPDGFLLNAQLLEQAAIETQLGWITDEGMNEADALERWEFIRDCEPLVIVGFVKAFYVLRATRSTDQ